MACGKAVTFVLFALWGTLFTSLYYRISFAPLKICRNVDVSCYAEDKIINVTVTMNGHAINRSAVCTIPTLNPWDEAVLPFVRHPRSFQCKKVQPELTYLTEDGLLALNTKERRKAEQRFGRALNCSYALLKRGATDNHIDRGAEIPLEDDFTHLDGDIVEVKCRKGTKEEYYNVHMKYQNDGGVIAGHEDQLSVVMILLESVSQSRMRRHLTETYSYLKDEMNAYILDGYNKIGENTFPNMMAFLTGKTVVSLPPNVKNEFPGRHISKDFFDDYPLIWQSFRSSGYSISFDEDRPDLGTFHYLKKGFKSPFFNFSSRTFHLALQRHSLYTKSKPFCFGNQAIAERQIELLRSVLRANSKGKKYFHISFFVDLSHDHENDIERIDETLVDGLKSAKEQHLLNNTVLFVLGDHGARYGDIRQTEAGFFEERMPFLSVSLPSWFTSKYEHIALNLKTNKQRLSTPFDLYETLSDILRSDFQSRSQNSFGRGVSLFHDLPSDRSCESAGIPEQFCVCYPAIKLDADSLLAQQAAQIILEHVNKILLKEISKCFQLELKNLVRISQVVKDLKDPALKLYRVVIKTSPNNALLESLVLHNLVANELAIVGDVGRINRYYSQSICANYGLLKYYCLCKDS